MQPTIHIVDNFVSANLITEVLAAWPPPSWSGWHIYKNGKRGSRTNVIPEECRNILNMIVDYVDDLYPTVIPDWSLWGCGLHDMRDNASLGFHRDAERHQLNPYWLRAVTAIVYLDTLINGGELVFGERVGNRVVVLQEVPSIAGQLVVFPNPDPEIVHAVKPVNHQVRRTLSLFFWSQQLQPQFFKPFRSVFVTAESWDNTVIWQ